MWQVISIYIGILIMMIGIILFARIVLNTPIKVSISKITILLLSTSILYTITYLYMTSTLKTIINCIIQIFTFKYLFKITYQKAIFLTFIYVILLIIPDALELVIATKILEVDKVIYYNVFAGSILGNLSICILFVILTFFMRKPLRKLMETQVEKNIKIIFFLLMTFLCIAVIFYKSFSNIKIDTEFIISVLAMIFFFTMLISLIKQTSDNNKLTKKYDNLLSFMITYENEIEKQRILRHETKNEFLTIKAKICDKQKEQEIINYIDEIVNDKITVKQEEYAKFGYLPPNGIKGLCYFKVQQAEEKGINIALNISKQIKKSNIYYLNIKQQREFGKIIGVFLDNAIEASLNSEEKKIGIEAYTNKEQEFKMIISNTYSNEIDKEKIGKESFSTKGKNRGHGLLLVKDITNNNKIFETKTEIQDKLYIQTIIVKNIKNES